MSIYYSLRVATESRTPSNVAIDPTRSTTLIKIGERGSMFLDSTLPALAVCNVLCLSASVCLEATDMTASEADGKMEVCANLILSPGFTGEIDFDFNLTPSPL